MLEDRTPSPSLSDPEEADRRRSSAPRSTVPDVDEPLDPAVERVRKKVSRLIAVSIGTLLVGVFAILGAVLYRSNAEPSTPSEGFVERDIRLLPGASVRGVSAADGGVVVEIALSDGTVEVVVLDPLTTALRSRVRFLRADADVQGLNVEGPPASVPNEGAVPAQ